MKTSEEIAEDFHRDRRSRIVYGPIDLGGVVITEDELAALTQMLERRTMSKIEEAANAVAAAMPGGRALDPTTIMAIADIIFQLIDRCRENRSAGDMHTAAVAPSFIERLVVRRQVKSELTRDQWRSIGHDVIEGVFVAGAKAEVEDIRTLIAEVRDL